MGYWRSTIRKGIIMNWIATLLISAIVGVIGFIVGFVIAAQTALKAREGNLEDVEIENAYAAGFDDGFEAGKKSILK